MRILSANASADICPSGSSKTISSKLTHFPISSHLPLPLSEMGVFSSPSISHYPMARPCNLVSLSRHGFSSLSLKPPAFSTGGKKFHGFGLIRASVAVEQQAEKTKVALVRIGTRGR